MIERSNNSIEAAPSNSAHTPLERITEALKGIRFGAVEIVIHEGRIVQIERREKLRFDASHDRRPPR